nr:hypothetical protein [Allomuricauda sp.]
MKLSKVQWTLVFVGMFLAFTGIYGKTVGWDNNDFITFFYTGTSLVWIAFLDSKKSKKCWIKRRKNEQTKTL